MISRSSTSTSSAPPTSANVIFDSSPLISCALLFPTESMVPPPFPMRLISSHQIRTRGSSRRSQLVSIGAAARRRRRPPELHVVGEELLHEIRILDGDRVVDCLLPVVFGLLRRT